MIRCLRDWSSRALAFIEPSTTFLMWRHRSRPPARGGSPRSALEQASGLRTPTAPFTRPTEHLNFGSMAGRTFDGSIVGIASTPDGGGFWLVASDGGVFTFGDAQFYGSMGATHLDAPIVGMASTKDGHGYWLVASDGGVFAFGDAPFLGSMGGKSLNAPMVAIAANPDAVGYWTAAADGGVFAFGDAPFFGSMAGAQLNAPVTGIATNP